MDEDFGLDSGFDDGGSLDLDTESTLDDTSFDTDYSLDDIGTDDFSGGSLEDTDFSSGAVDDDFESFNDSDLSGLDTDFSAEEMLTDTGSELDLSPDSIETDDFGDIETDLNLEEPGDSFDLDESVDGTETEPEFPADSDEGGYFEDIPNEVEPYVLEEAQTETTADTAESIPETEQDDRTPYEAMRDYMYEHNYGQMDYPEYSQDPEWQALNEQYTASLENTAPAEEITPESEAEFQEDISAVASDVPEEIMTEAAADIPEESMTETTADIPEETMTETTADTAESIPETEQDDRTPYEAMRDYMYEHNYGQMDYPEYSQDPEWQALNDAYTESLNTPADITDAAATDAQIPQDVQTLDNIDAAAADVNDWISEINPNFDPYDLDSAYDNNCGSCAFAVYQRFEGNTDIVASAENIATIEEMNALTGMEQVTMTPEEIQQTLLDQGNGAHAIIGIDRADGPGHWFNAANIDGKVVAIDGQTGEISDWPPDYGDVTNWDMSMKKGH